MTRRRTPLWTAIITASLVALTMFPGLVAARGSVQMTVNNVVNQGGQYSEASPAAGFFDVTALDIGDSHLTHQDMRIYFPISIVPLAAFYLKVGVQTLEAACSRPNRGGDASLPAFLCSWDENWAVGDGKGPITFAVGGTIAGTFTITATLSPAAQPPIGSGTNSLTVSTVDAGDRATRYTGPSSALTVQTSPGGSQQTRVGLPSTTNGYVVSIAETTDGFTCNGATPSGQIGQKVNASINQGAQISGGIQWTMTIVVKTKKAFDTSTLAVYHCTVSGPSEVLDTITQAPADVCGSPTAAHGCMNSLTSTSVFSKGWYTTTITVQFRTLSNGFVKSGNT